MSITGEILLLFMALAFGFYTAWNIGANDVSNAMGTSVGSRALTLRQAVCVAAIFEFTGATLFGSNVSETLQKGIIHTEAFANMPLVFVYGMLGSLLAAGVWLHMASYCGLPVSTTHAIVGAIVGFGACIGGVDAVQWEEVASIAISWVISPILGSVISYLLFTWMRQKIFYSPAPLESTIKTLPWLVGALVFIILVIVTPVWHDPVRASMIVLATIAVISITRAAAPSLARRYRLRTPAQRVSHGPDPFLLEEVNQTKKHLQRLRQATSGEIAWRVSDIIGEVDGVACTLEQHPEAHSDRQGEFYLVEKVFVCLQVATACLMAFSHGSNDVANAIGPLAAILSVLKTGSLVFSATFPLWILVLGGTGIVVGLATWGWRVIETIGKKITELTPSRGFAAEFGAAMTILLATHLGFPISTTHTLVGSVLGVGMAGGLGSLNLRTIRDIVLAWFVTLPAGALLSIGAYWLISACF